MGAGRWSNGSPPASTCQPSTARDLVLVAKAADPEVEALLARW